MAASIPLPPVTLSLNSEVRLTGFAADGFRMRRKLHEGCVNGLLLLACGHPILSVGSTLSEVNLLRLSEL
jgi:hypothetical protein